MNDVDADIDLDIDEETGKSQQYQDVEHPKSLIPAELDVTTVAEQKAAENSEKFSMYYLNLMTTGFGEDLNTLRESKDFTSQSMPLIIKALKEGINMFDADQRNLILSAATTTD